ncbi:MULTISPECIES: hypothetical protein [Anaerotruncus]|uniref:Uncharacterized protein n=2 Tax=Anaerotruncus TaxID=244127 RepID=A0A498CSP3_9FIRM|nr:MULTISPECIES: hypothetical protein [Anaerotruncus]MBC3939695.1 hypothetical protein [Anaerotruncus massiliensis (ex Togo et al. 2019)]MCQ4894655.1 hypothetical protein [Anaerotruncus sp. DFI.9.16]RLL08398.1 hypothetical protein D4A47_12205 [Anaerotruncus massiliensis (ex Liu et al. 2021)]
MEEKTKKNGGAVKWAFPVVILILVGVIAWLLLRPQEQPAGLTRAADAQLGQLEGKTEEQIVEELNRIVEEGMFNISINTQPEFPDGSSPGNLCIENSPANHYLMVVEITLNDTGEKVYTSGALEPNYHIQEAKLDRALAKGTYPATATFYAYTADTQELVGTAGAEMQLIIQN